jgi:DNA-binding SARP family transcriptional activator
MAIWLALLALWVLFVFLIPKRGLGTISERLRQTAQGDRIYVFGPPPQLGSGYLAALAGEAMRLIETGLPLYVAGLRAEAQGQHRRAAVVLVREPLPAAPPKARPSRPRQYAMPPMAWRREWEATLLREDSEATLTELSTIPLPAGAPPSPSSLLRIRTLGTFQLLYQGEDLAPKLLARPTLCFIWLYLLSHAALQPSSCVHRQLLAEELTPGVGSDQQRLRLRHRLYAYQRVLPAAIAQRIRLEGDLVRLEAAGTSFDVASLQKTADEWASGTGLLPPDAVAELETSAAMCDGEYLPIWDELEERLTEGRGAAGELVRSVRQLVQDLQVRLVLRLAGHHQARRDLPHVIPLLEEVLRRRPDREDVANRLAAAYRQSGQSGRAEQLETTYRADFTPAGRRPDR